MSIRDSVDNHSPKTRPLETISAGTLGVLLFLAALTVLFGATIAGYLFVRSQAPTWPPPGSPAVPMASLWLSTLLILLISGTSHWALRSIRWGRDRRLRLALVLTIVLAVLFLANQARNWQNVRATIVPVGSHAQTYAAVFYLLTGTHALHVVGGLVLLAIVTRKAFRGDYTSAYHAGVRYNAMYWHFLDGVWLMMFGTMFLFG